MGYTFKRPDPAAMERILTQFPYSPEGAILRLAWLEGLSREEIAALTWDQVQFEDNALTLPDRTVPLAPSAEAESLTREEVMDLLGVSKSAALKLLNQLRQDGAVVRIGGCYYPAGAVVLPEDQSAAVTAYLAAHGTAVRKELAELLNLPPAQCTALLRRMADRGELLLTGKRYALPPQKKPLETN